MSRLFLCLLIVSGLVTACQSQTATPSPTAPSLTPTTVAGAQTAPENLISVLTNRYNTARTGANLEETILNQANVNPDQFGKLFSREVVGHIYAQPLYVPNVDIPGQGTHNVVYVATMNNRVYAFDADDPALADPLWEVSLGEPFTQNISVDIPGGEDGILSTPVIDPGTHTIYLVTRNWENEQAVHKLHALDIRTGESRDGSPTLIDLSMPGTGINNQNGIVHLDSYYQLQRTGLLLHNNHLYFGFSAHCCDWWFGWLPAYNAQTLELSALFNTTPNGYFGGIWMSGSGIATDGDHLYFGTGNGTFTADTGGTEYANSVLKLQHTESGIAVADYFTPANWREMDMIDADIGSAGVVLIPDSNLLVIGGKDSNLYLIDRSDMGGFDPDTNANLQTIPLGMGRMFVTPVYWDNGPNEQSTVFTWTEHDVIKAFTLDRDARQLISEPSSTAQIRAAGMPIGSLSLSANGLVSETAMLWALYAPLANEGDYSGVLVALDATNLQRIIWSSDMNDERDEVGLLAKFNPATIANGRVYVPSFSNRLNVYGLLN